jgi:hypothetical protein
MAAAAGVPRMATVHDLDNFVAAFSEALAENELTTLVAKVEAKGPPVFLTDLPMLEYRFQFARYLKILIGVMLDA